MRSRVLAWAAVTLFLVAWFLAGAYLAYPLIPRNVIAEALRELAGIGSGGGLVDRALTIFMNNVRILVIGLVPVLGLFVELAALLVTAAVGRYASELLASALGGCWDQYFFKLIVATPFFPLEMLAYGIAVAESLLFLRHRSLRRFLSGAAVAVAVLAVAAVVEAATMEAYGLGG